MPVSNAEIERHDLTAVSATLLQNGNRTRRGFYIYNEPGNARCYVKMGEAATTEDYSVQILPGQFWEFPGNPIYVGPISAILESGTGSIQTTELYG